MDGAFADRCGATDMSAPPEKHKKIGKQPVPPKTKKVVENAPPEKAAKSGEVPREPGE